MDPEVIEFQIG